MNFYNFWILMHILHFEVGLDHDLTYSFNLLMDVSFFIFWGSAFHRSQCHETFATVLYSIAVFN